MRTWGMAVGLVLVGCAGGIQRTIRPPSAPLALTTVFVYPVQFGGAPEPAWRSFELSQRMIDVALREAGDSLAFFGPSEFKVLKAESDQGWVATNALLILTGSGSRATQGVMLRAFADKRVASSMHETQDKTGRTKATSTEETTWVVRVELLHPSTGEVLVEVSGQVTIDPFAEPGPDADFDPAPPFTRLLEKLTRETVAVAAKYAAERQVAAEHGLTLAPTAPLTLAYEDERPAAAAEMAKMDALQVELFVQNRTRFLSPWLTDGQAAKLANAQAGLAVVAAPSSSKLAAGDLIEKVDGATALPQTLARVRFLQTPVQLQVRRADGSGTEIVFP